MQFQAYSDKAELCDPSCLLPEIRKERYPLPTGLGLQCVPGTCHPFVQSQNLDSPAELECPCNWFGADCPNDWVRVEGVQVTQTFDNGIIAITLSVEGDLRSQLFDQHQPGGVIRVVQRNHTTGMVQEQPYAVAYYGTLEEEGSTPRTQIDLLAAPPDTNLDPHPRAVAERVRRLASSLTATDTLAISPIDNLFINPSIGGFFNKPSYTYLLDFLQSSQEKIDRLIVVSTGAGLSGALSAVEMVPVTNKHLYHGLRTATADELPYRERLEEWKANGGLDLHIVESRPLGNDQDKMYAQHALGHDVSSTANHFGVPDKHQLLSSTVFVVCGRMELLTKHWRHYRTHSVRTQMTVKAVQ